MNGEMVDENPPYVTKIFRCFFEGKIWLAKGKSMLYHAAMRSPALLLAFVLVTACQFAPVDTETDAGPVTLEFEKTTSEDELATLHTKASLSAADQTIDLGDILGDLIPVKASAYGIYDGEVLLVLTSWWAGQGEEIVVTRSEDGIMVTHRFGDESGTCTEATVLGEIKVSGDAEVTLKGLGTEILDQSSIRFCYE